MSSKDKDSFKNNNSILSDKLSLLYNNVQTAKNQIGLKICAKQFANVSNEIYKQVKQILKIPRK